MLFYGIYPPVIKHGLLENGPFIGDFPIETSISSGFPSQPHLMKPEGKRTELPDFYGQDSGTYFLGSIWEPYIQGLWNTWEISGDYGKIGNIWKNRENI